MFASSAPGLEPMVASELEALGVPIRVVDGGVEFSGGVREMYAANLWLRTATRVLVDSAHFHASSFHELERRANHVPWENWLARGSAVRFRVTCRKSKLYHSDAVAERLLNSVTKRVSAVAGNGEEGQLFVVRLYRDDCTVRADSSGELLHRRGYRQALAKAPLRETLAAAMVMAAEWDGVSPLVDPFCGSGTIPIEAALIARKIAPGINRAFAFEHWPSHEAAGWGAVKEKARNSESSKSPAQIIASDRDEGAVESTIENAKRAGVDADLDISVRTISQIDLPPAPGWIVTNPPYGVRVGERAGLRDLYAAFGNTVRRKATGYRITMLSADPSLESQLRLDLEEAFRTTNGGIPVRLLAGSIG